MHVVMLCALVFGKLAASAWHGHLKGVSTKYCGTGSQCGRIHEPTLLC